MSLMDRLFREENEAPALERRRPLNITAKFGAGKGSGGPLEPKPVSAKPVSTMIKNVTARPVATGKEGHIWGKALAKSEQTFALVAAVLDEAKKKGFVSQEISHLMHGHASKGPLKGKHVPQKQAVAIALNVARRKGIETGY